MEGGKQLKSSMLGIKIEVKDINSRCLKSKLHIISIITTYMVAVGLYNGPFPYPKRLVVALIFFSSFETSLQCGPYMVATYCV